MISMVAAMDEHRLIGNGKHLPWHCEGDLTHFYRLTSGQTLVMGRHTYESLPTHMLHKHIYVVTHHTLPIHETGTLCHDFMKLLKEWKNKKEYLYVCGGTQIYEQAFPYVDEIWLSFIKGVYEGDTYLPDFDTSCFQECHMEAHQGFMLYHYHHRMEKKEG